MEKELREIKFRAWHKELLDMTYSFNAYDGKPMSNFFWKIDTYPDMYHLMQFTGLKINGVDIYEGDIIQPKKYVDTNKFKGVVVFKKGCFKIEGNIYPSNTSLYNQINNGIAGFNDELTVIGNIYTPAPS